jgi:hypothetical protein
MRMMIAASVTVLMPKVLFIDRLLFVSCPDTASMTYGIRCNPVQRDQRQRISFFSFGSRLS